MFICKRHDCSGTEPSCPYCQNEANQRLREALELVEGVPGMTARTRSSFITSFWQFYNAVKEAEAMKTPTQEQLKDPDYWNLVAPDWADSYGVAGIDRNPVWLNLKKYAYWENGKTFQYGAGCCFGLGDIEWQASRPKPQPTDAKTESQEWVDGLPPVGVEVELREPLSPCAYRYFTGRVVGYDEEMSIKSAVCRVGDEYHAYKPSQLRPLKTDAERGREEVCSEAVKVAHQAIKHFGISGQIPMATIMTALYDAGMLRKGGES